MTSGCDQRTPPPEPELPPAPRDPQGMAAREARELQREFAELQAEAGIETHDDPPPPSGDLKADIESFTTLDACVRTRTPSDPLL